MMINNLQYYLIAVLCCLVLVSGCASDNKQPEMGVKQTEKKEIQKTTQKEHIEKKQEFQSELEKEAKIKETIETDIIFPKQIQAWKKKKVFDFVKIGGKQYLIPVPWRGKKIQKNSPPQSQLKQIPLEFTWNKSQIFLEKKACDAFVSMAEKAKEEGIELKVHSGFRSVRYQINIFKKLMAQGRTWEDLVRYVAPPGYSEHMLGEVVDLYPSNWQFAQTPAYHWLKENGSTFGFAETYPQHGENGFPWEAWHWRYHGPEVILTVSKSLKHTIPNNDVESQEKK